MVKTTVYLDDRDAAALRRMSAESGRSQAKIIRQAFGHATRAAEPRRLRSRRRRSWQRRARGPRGR